MKVLIFVSALAVVFTSAEFYCGQPLKDRRIIGGDPAKPFQFPWQVVLYYANYENALSCGGTIISSRTILTAAHCVSSYVTQWVGIPEGGVEYQNIRKVRVESFEAHPSFDYNILNYDFAVLTLEEELEFGEGILPICLPSPYDNFDDVQAAILGWGYTENDVIPDELMVANVTTMPNKECQEFFSPSAVIDSSMICAAHPGKDTCQGDSGGPMMTLRQEEAYYVQIGVTSWGYGCARDHPGVYSRVTDQLYWIFSKMTGRTLPTPVARTMDN